jgi:hypothetical protein
MIFTEKFSEQRIFVGRIKPRNAKEYTIGLSRIPPYVTQHIVLILKRLANCQLAPRKKKDNKTCEIKLVLLELLNLGFSTHLPPTEQGTWAVPLYQSFSISMLVNK